MLCCAVWVYLDENKHLQRLHLYFRGKKERNKLNEEVTVGNVSSECVTESKEVLAAAQRRNYKDPLGNKEGVDSSKVHSMIDYDFEGRD